VSGAILVLLNAGVIAQETVQPPPTPTPVAEPTEADAEAEAKALEDQKTVQLNPYPEQAKMKAGEKWRLFTDATRGLLVWDFFDGKLTIRAHAKVQVDGTVPRPDQGLENQTGALGSGFDLRTFEAVAQGTIDHHLHYSVAFDFGTDTGFGEVFVEGTGQGLNVFGYRIGQFRVGLFQEPFSFQRITSSYYSGFLERSLPVSTFSPGNNIGYMVHDTAHKGRMQWAVGFFSFGQQNETNSSNSVLSVTARMTGLPVYRDNGRQLVHLGASYSTRDPGTGDTQYRSRPEARFVDFFVDTGNINAGRIQLYGIEAVGVRGPFSLQSEVIASRVQGTGVSDLLLWGGYVEVGYFLTGEHRTYDKELAVFSRVAPKEEIRGINPFKKGGLGGALELTGRYSTVDLDDGEIHGGSMTDLGLGVNWYLSTTSAVKFNYIYSDVKDVGHANIFVLRYQFRPLPVPGWR
jgi:phosphate-selective porin OprO/OprP